MSRMKGVVGLGMVAAVVAVNAWAGPLKLADVSTDAKWVAHLDLLQLRETRLGQYLMEALSTGGAGSKLAVVQAVFNFDPRTDLDGLTMYGKGTAERNGVLLMRGRLDGERLVTLVKANDTYESSTYGSYTVHSWIDDKEARKAEARGREPKRSCGAIFTDGTIVLSDSAENVGRALDVLTGKLPAMRGNEMVAGLTGWRDAYFLIAAAETGEMADLAPNAALLKGARRLGLIVGETGDQLEGKVSLEAPDAEMAGNMKRIADGMIALALVNAENNPAVARLAQASQVTVNDKRVELRMSSPVSALIEAIEAKKQGTAGTATP